jgi:hypothetical protein
MAKIAAGARAALREQLAEAHRAEEKNPAVRDLTLDEVQAAYDRGFEGEAIYHAAVTMKQQAVAFDSLPAKSSSSRVVTASRGTSRERRNPSSRAGRKSGSRSDPDREPPPPPLTRLQRVRLAISDARRARLGPDDWRECPGCLREFEPTEFRSRRICRSCESKARLARFEVAA